MKPKNFYLEFITVILINLLTDMRTIAKNSLIVDSLTDLEAEMCRYNCQTKDELKEVLWHDYNAALILNFKYRENE